MNKEYNVLCVDKHTNCSKLYYLFNNLDISHLYVTDKSGVIGYITKEEFFKFKPTSVR